jgi:tetratricopeptide (TPR) repeat protein
VGPVRKDILNGWKEIASYVGRDIRTVERWEKQRGLPIRRVPGAGRATVYAVVSELDEWFASASTSDAFDNDDEPFDSHTSSIAASATATPVTAALPETTSSEAAPAQNGAAATWTRIAAGWKIAGAAAAVLAVGFAGWMAGRTLHRERMAAAHSAAPVSHYSFDVSHTTPGVPYPSRVAGVDELFLRGIYSYEQRTPEALKHSESEFSEAIAKDPGYAPAYAGIATTYLLQREYSVLPDASAYPKAKVAAQHALQLDPNLPQAHACLGFIDFFWEADPVTAEHEFRTALKLDPSGVLTLHWYGSVLTHEGRYTEALKELDLAQRLQPTSAAILSSRALALGLSGHRNEAVDMMQELLNEAPTATSPHQILSILSLVEPRDIPRWLDESRRIAELRHDTTGLQYIAVSEAAYRKGGEPGLWNAIVRFDQQHRPISKGVAFNMAGANAALGNFDAAFSILTQLANERSSQSVIIAMDPLLVELRNDPRYPQLFAATGIPAAMKIH